jgi:hypothetical protein
VFSATTEYVVEITWDDGTLGGSDNDISVEVFDDSGTSLAGPITANDSTFSTEGGIGFGSNGNSTANFYYDWYRLV